MVCPSCSMKNNYYHRYCFNCGTRLINEEFPEEEQLFSEEQQLLSKTDSFESEEEMEEPEEPMEEPEEQMDEGSNEDLDEDLVEDMSKEIDEDINEDIDENMDDEDPEESFDPDDSMNSELWAKESWDGPLDEQFEKQSEEQLEEELTTQPEDDILSTPESETQSQMYTGSFDDIFSDFVLPTKEEEDTEFDIQTQLPLRRYRKTEKNSNNLQRTIKIFIAIILISLVGLLFYVGYVELFQRPAANKSAAKSIDFEYEIEEIDLDGETARRIVVVSSIGEQIKVRDKVAAVISGQGEIILPDSEFNLDEFEQSDGALQVFIPLTVLADGYPSRTEDIYFEVPIQAAPLELVSPSSNEVFVDGTIYPLIVRVLPGSNVYLDDNNYSHLVDEQGQLSVQLEIPQQSDETRYEIRVSANGYADTLDHIVFKKKQMEFPLAIDQEMPIQASADVWVEITGNTQPEAILSTNLEVRDEIELDPDSGNFKLFVRAPAKGYTPFILTAELEDKEDSVLETVIHRPVNENEYTHSAWALEYDNLKAYPDLHNGIPFVFTGTITDVQSTGTKTTLLVNIAAQGQPEQLVYVEHWETSNFSPGQQLRVFGNRWGNREDYPYILASYIYR